jgi:hypothetical protein
MPLKKLTDDEMQDTTALIKAIEHKDRRFRLFQLLFMLSTFIALIIIISAQQRTLNGVERQLKEARESSKQQADQSTKATDIILRRLDCMTVFFSQRDRTNLTIENVDRCTLNRSGDIQQFFRENPNSPTGVDVTPEQQPTAPTPTELNQQGSTQDMSERVVEDPTTPMVRTLDLPLMQIEQPICVTRIICLQ